MPLQVIEMTDPLTNLIRFRTSPVYELLLSLSVLLHPMRRDSAWVARAREALEPAFWTELAALYEPYGKGGLFFEMAIDYPDHEDVEGFFEYVRALDPVHFVFYLTGRVVPVERLAATGLEPAAVWAALDEVKELCYWLYQDSIALEPILADVPAFQERLTALWRWYWDAFFRHEVDALRPHWERAIRDKASILSRAGGQGLFEYVLGKSELPPPLPPDHPITSIVFTPIYLMPSPVYMFYGYGNVTVLFDSERTEARRTEIERGKEQALTVLKALSDGSRLDILRLIARHEAEMHGKKIAAKLNLSASAVSRHLSQLRDAGLIEEHVHEDRTITYRLRQSVIERLPDTLFEYFWYT